jgi:hypothetical protein
LATSEPPSREALNVYDQLLAGFGDDAAPPLRLLCCRALANKGVLLARLGESERALAACDEVLIAHRGEASPLMHEQHIKALLNKGLILAETGNTSRATSVLARIVADHSTDSEPSLRGFAERAQAALDKITEGDG